MSRFHLNFGRENVNKSLQYLPFHSIDTHNIKPMFLLNKFIQSFKYVNFNQLSRSMKRDITRYAR